MELQIDLTVNGTRRAARVAAGTALVDFLRHGLGLTGAHVGCRSASCGACTVLLDGSPVKSCCVLAAEADGSVVETVEHGEESGPDAVQEAFVACQAMQCGFCTPGMVVSVRALLAENPEPSRDEARRAIAGNLCRCTGYTNILTAIDDAARRRRADTLSPEV
jgi:aerobic-type carbon monoxide dehydrogenase small subunit (CoxS/CutS family)